MKHWLIALGLVLTPASVYAGKVKSVTWSQPGHYDKALLQNAVVGSDGKITLAKSLRQIRTRAPIDAARVWDIAEDRVGNLYLATGDEGKILRITPDGQIQVAFETKDSQVLCLLALPDGGILAGTGPNGLVVRIDPDGKGRVWHDSPARYIWALVRDERTGSLYAATGSPARVYRLTPNGESEVYFECPQDHVLTLALAAEGPLFAGTDRRGLVYRIDERGKGVVIFQAAQSEVRCLQWTPQGLYVGTSSPGRAPRSNPGTTPPPAGVGSLPNRDADAVPATVSSPPAPLADTPSRDRSNPPERFAAAVPEAPKPGDNSVYLVGFDGTVRELYRDKGLVLSLLVRGERLLIGTASKGQLIELDPTTRSRREISRMDAGQVYRLVPRRDGRIMVAASDPGRIFELSDQFESKGSVVGEVIDARLISRWGALTWAGDTPPGTSIKVAVRGGNVSEPDDTWTPWSDDMADPGVAAVSLPPARFLQVRVTLTSSDPAVSPSLHHLTVRYATLNQPPEVTSLETPTAEAIASSKDPKRIRFKWNATDANEDELVFDLYVRKSTWNDWVRIEESWAKNEYEWDTTTMPSGEYRFKVVASDRPDNGDGSALQSQRISEPVSVAHELPTVKLKATVGADDRVQLQAEASSTSSRLYAAAFAVDGGRWTSLQPQDGLFDSRSESFQFQTMRLEPGSHVIVVRVRDASGNWGMADAVVTISASKP